MVVSIETFAFFDLETTGLPWQERNQTKIVEICILAVGRNELFHTQSDKKPTARLLSFLLNPAPMRINPKVSAMTVITSQELEASKSFGDQYNVISKFLSSLPKPVCLIAHNGDAFDFKIFKAEVKDIKKKLPNQIFCADSLKAYRELDKTGKLRMYPYLNQKQCKNVYASNCSVDEWPDLNISSEEFKEIDDLCDRMSNVSTDPDSPVKGEIMEPVKSHNVQPKKLLDEMHFLPRKAFEVPSSNNTTSYTLSNLYERVTQKPPLRAHRAEVDCRMLMEIVMTTRDVFLPWVDENCKSMGKIRPLLRSR